MRIQTLVCALFVLVFCASCSDEAKPNETATFGELETWLTEEETKVLLRMRNPNNRVSIDEVLKEADWIIDFFDEENALKSGSNNRKVSSISALVSSSPALKSGGSSEIEIPDTLAYVLNFGDNLGFAIISADTRIDDPLLAFTSSGSLIDSTDNPGIAIFLEHLEEYMINSIMEAEQQKDSLIDGIMEKLDIETGTKATDDLIGVVIRDTTETVAWVKPLVPVEWSQGPPFDNNLDNRQCTNNDYKNKVGCVAVAVAHIMSRWKYPSSINGISLDWDELNKYKRADDMNNAPPYPDVKYQVAYLMQQIGKSVKMKYGCAESEADTQDAVTFLKNIGFSLWRELVQYHSGIAIASINGGEPLIVRGCSNKHTILGILLYYDKCHAWVIDGYLKRQTSSIMGNRPPTITSTTEYVHNNWGWTNGFKNGYFRSGVFNSVPGPDIPSSGTKSDEAKNYKYDIKMTFDMRR